MNFLEHSFSATLALLFVTAGAIIGMFALSPAEPENRENLPASNEEYEEAPEKEPEMKLGVFEGKLALFIGESPYPNKIYDFSIRTLPEEDKLLLEKGMKISSEEELLRLLEDLTS